MKTILSFLLVITILSCQSDKNSFTDENLKDAYANYNNDKTEKTAREFAGAIVKYMVENPEGADTRTALQEGITVSDQFNLRSAKASFMTAYLKDYPADKANVEYTYDLATTLDSLNKKEAANALYYSFLEKYKDDPRTETVKARMTKGITDIDGYIRNLGEGIFSNPDELGINRRKAQAYVDACEAYAIVNPESVVTPEFLYKASEIARTLKTYPKVLSLYDWIIKSYPDYEKTPTCLFLKGFILENDLNNDEEAKKVYEEFVQKHPNHQLADDVQFLLENIDKSDEEIMQIISQKSKNNEE